MIEILSSIKKDIVIPMYKMKPLEIGIIVNDNDFHATYVMRTASEKKFEVMDLTSPGPNKCWEGNPDMKVKLLAPDEYIDIRLFNKQEVYRDCGICNGYPDKCEECEGERW